MIQTILTIMVVSLASTYLVRRLFLGFTKKNEACDSCAFSKVSHQN